LKWGIFTGVLIVVFATVYQVRRLPSDIRQFEELDARHKVTLAALERYQHISNVLGDGTQWLAVVTAIRNLEQANTDAFEALKVKQLPKAEELMAHAEAEASAIQAAISDRIRLSLRDELSARLEQARRDCDALEQEFAAVGLQAESSLRGIRESIESLRGALPRTTFDETNLVQALAPYEVVFREIVNTRTALRFRNNVASVLDACRADLDNSRVQIDLTRSLNEDASSVETTCKKAIAAISELSSQRTLSSQSLIATYQELQKEMTLLRSLVANLATQRDRKYQARSFDSNSVSVFVPRRATTTAPSYAAVLVRPGLAASSSFRAKLQSVLLELPDGPELNTEARPTGEYGLSSISFVGQRGGKGTLIVSIEEPVKLRQRVSFEVAVQPSAWESGRDAAVFGAPIGGVAVWGLWLLYGDIQYAGPLGLALGSAAAMGLFLVQRVRARIRWDERRAVT
jgi:hypothetical protein